MNITFDKAETKTAGLYADSGSRSAYASHGTEKTQESGFSLDISGSIMDNSAYAEHFLSFHVNDLE